MKDSRPNLAARSTCLALNPYVGTRMLCCNGATARLEMCESFRVWGYAADESMR